MREVERERNVRVMQQLEEEEKRREEESKERMLKLSEADSMMNHAEEVLESLEEHTDFDARAADIQSALRSLQGARSLYVTIGALPQRRRRLVAVERLLDLEYSKRADGDTHLRIARKHVESVTVPEGDRPMPRKMTDGALKEAKRALRKARAEYERTGALEDAEEDIEKVEEMMEHVIEYLNKPPPETDKPQEEEEERLVIAEAEEEEEESDEEDLEPGPDEEQAELFKVRKPLSHSMHPCAGGFGSLMEEMETDAPDVCAYIRRDATRRVCWSSQQEGGSVIALLLGWHSLTLSSLVVTGAVGAADQLQEGGGSFYHQ